MRCGLLALSLAQASSTVDWATFLQRHDAEWEWRTATEGSMIAVADSRFAHCGDAGCCVVAAPDGVIELGACDATVVQVWKFDAGAIAASDGGCLTGAPVGDPLVLAPCNGSSVQKWARFGGFIQVLDDDASLGVRASPPPARCVAIDAAGCNVTSMAGCTMEQMPPLSAGARLVAAACNNGDPRQRFAELDPRTGRENLEPLTWASAAWTGNGLVGVHAQSEGADALAISVDRVDLVSSGHRLANGYLRLNFSGAAARVVRLRQSLHDASIAGAVADDANATLLSFDIFVNAADLERPVAIVEVANHSAEVVLEWVPQQADAEVIVVDANTTVFRQRVEGSGESSTAVLVARSGGGGEVGVTAFIAVTNITATADSAALAAETASSASRAGAAAAREAHLAWWHDEYWPSGAFVSVPDTRLEAMYVQQVQRFAASQRVGLHGLVGAFGPSGPDRMSTLWPDEVWDMNEQVMYWIAHQANRPAMVAPLVTATLDGELPGGEAGLWMLHNAKRALDAGAAGNASDALAARALDLLRSGLADLNASLSVDDAGVRHLEACDSPEYRCYPPYEALQCAPSRDCAYGLSLIRWAARSAAGLCEEAAGGCADAAWFASLAGGGLAPPPFDSATGYMLDAACTFDCPHRHFSHLLHAYDLELDGASAAGELARVRLSLDRWYGITCGEENVFNEECRGFTQCALAGISLVAGRPRAVVGNLSRLVAIDSNARSGVLTPNALYGASRARGAPGPRAPAVVTCVAVNPQANWCIKALRACSRPSPRAPTAAPASCTPPSCTCKAASCASFKASPRRATTRCGRTRASATCASSRASSRARRARTGARASCASQSTPRARRDPFCSGSTTTRTSAGPGRFRRRFPAAAARRAWSRRRACSRTPCGT